MTEQSSLLPPTGSKATTASATTWLESTWEQFSAALFGALYISSKESEE